MSSLTLPQTLGLAQHLQIYAKAIESTNWIRGHLASVTISATAIDLGRLGGLQHIAEQYGFAIDYFGEAIAE